MTKPSPADYQPLPGSKRPRPESHNLIGPVDAAELISVTILIRPRPGSPPIPDLEYWQRTPVRERRFLTPEEFAQTYGATQADLDAVAAFVSSHGMTVLESHAGRRNVNVQGTAAKMNAAFGVKLNHYEAPLPVAPPHTMPSETQWPMPAVSTHIYHGYNGPVFLPTELAGIIVAVIGLDNRTIGAPAGSGDPGNAFYVSVPTIVGDYHLNIGSKAADQVIAVIAPQDTPGNGSSYLSSDIYNLYFPSLQDPNPPASINDINLTVGTNTFMNSPTTVQGITNTTNLNAFPYSFIVELTQDISTAATSAQGVTINVYFTENSEPGWVAFLNRVLVPEGEKQPTVLTCSFFLSRSDDPGSIGSVSQSGSTASVMSGLFQSLATQGISVFIAAGDWGADDGVIDGKTHVNYPGSDPWITSCGGTIVGNMTANSSYAEFAWSDAFSNSQFGSSNTDFGATGGGASANFPVPSYQTAAGITQIKDSKGNTLTGRFVPDIAAMVAYNGFFVNGRSYSFVGTSCVAPLYAGAIASLRSALGLRLGQLNSILYQLGITNPTNPATYVFNDVTYGNNDSGDTPNSPYFTAGPGWDACTGWGSIDGTKLWRALK